MLKRFSNFKEYADLLEVLLVLKVVIKVNDQMKLDNSHNMESTTEKDKAVIRFYTGSYNKEGAPALNPIGEGIGTFTLNTKNGTIVNEGYYKQSNPSYICISPDDKYLYAVEELPEGNGAKVFSYQIALDGSLNLLNSKSIPGGYACHLSICAQQLIIANYMSGNAIFYGIQANGSLSDIKQIIQNDGIGPNEARQEAPHMHMVYPWAEDRIFIIDLSLDTAHSYVYDNDRSEWLRDETKDLKLDAGAGARHMVMNNHRSLAFVIGELKGEIFVFDRKEERFDLIQKISYVDDKNGCEPSGAAIKIHPNGKLLYASDRSSNKIAIYKINNSTRKISLVEFADTEGKCPRDFSFDPSGQWLIATNQESNNVVLFKVNTENGTLVKQMTVEVNTPVNVCFQLDNRVNN